jgi:hypothetical protein
MAEKITTKIVRKLSMKLLAGDVIDAPREGEGDENGVVWLANIAGMAVDTKVGESQYGPYKALVGQFVAEAPSRDKPGEMIRFRTGTLYLPDVALDLVAPAVEQSAKGENVQFAFRIGIQRDTTSATNYVYVAESLIEPEASDPMEVLAKTALKNAPKPAGLPSPVQ